MTMKATTATSIGGHPWREELDDRVKVDESDENKGRGRGGYSNSGKHLTRILALRLPWIPGGTYRA